MYLAAKRRCVQAVVLLAVLLRTGGVLAAQPLAKPAPPQGEVWWKHAVVYEIYPRSFQDSNGDGVGDLNGIADRLDYLQSLGVDAIWIAPMYPSPQVDFGYDVEDYENVDPQYGTLTDFDRLEREAQKRHIRIILDMVLNHTSDKHRWFIESASSRSNAKADWYVWNGGIPASSPDVGAFQKRNAHQGPNGEVVPPNNWESLFGGSAWEWVPARGQFYYHKFYKQQPDLNWRNPAVEHAMFAQMRFWLDRGVAGFRLDAITTLYEDPQLRNEHEIGGTNAQGDPRLDNSMTDNLPEEHDVIRRMRAMVEKYPDNRVLIGETYLPNVTELERWYGVPTHDELQLPMDMLLGFHGDSKLNAGQFSQRIEEAEAQLQSGQPLFVFDNHDNRRSIDRYGDGKHDVAIAKVLAAVLFTTRVTALTYYGAELGMHTGTPTRKEDVKDPIGVTGWPREKGRDGERTPMQWTPRPQAGFSMNPHTWLPVESDYKTVNVQSELNDPGSLLNWNRKLIALRRRIPALHNGVLQMVGSTENVLEYLRHANGAKDVLVMMNMSASVQVISLDERKEWSTTRARTLAASDDAVSFDGMQITLPPYSVWLGIEK
jgi:alpha-glucosidase